MSNELFNINQRAVGGVLVDTVDARLLHEFLESKQRFSDWIKGRIDKYGFTQGVDFSTNHKIMTGGFGGTSTIEYSITLDMAKELSMVERNEKGRQARQYFIRCEKQLRESSAALPQDFAAALRLAADNHEELLRSQRREAESQALIESQRPDVEFVRQITHDPSSMSVAEAAKSIGTGERRLYAFMRQHGWIDRKNVPYQVRVASGMMDFSRSRYDNGRGELRDKYTARITEKGKRYLLKKIKEEAPSILDGHDHNSELATNYRGKRG